MQYKEFTNSHSKNLLEKICSIMETHMVGKTIIVNGKKGKVIEQVGSDGKTESDEIYKVKFEDGTVKDIPARDMEMQGDISNQKEPSENEAEDIVNESYDEKGLLKKGLTHAIYSKGPSGQIHFTHRRKKFADFKAKMYTDGIQFNQKDHPGFGVMIVPHGTPNGKSVHKDHEKYYGKTDESVELDELEKKTLIDYKNKAGAQVASDLYTDTGKHTPKTNRRARGVIKAKARLLAPEELAISPERLADTRKNIEKHLKSKKKEEGGNPFDGIVSGDIGANIEKYIKSRKKKKNQDLKDHFELDEGKMSEIDARRREGQTPEQIAKGMNVHVDDIKKILGIRKTKPHRNPMESIELDEYSGEYDPEYNDSMQAHADVEQAEREKGKPLTDVERKHHEDKAYHKIGYRDRDGARIEKEAGKTLTYAEMQRAKRRVEKKPTTAKGMLFRKIDKLRKRK